MKRIFKALVIDDESARNSTYEEVLSRHFQVEFINEPSSVTKRTINKYDLLVMDLYLSPTNAELNAFQLIEDYRISIPVVLVSGQWVSEKGEPSKDILKVPRYKNICKVSNWRDFVNEKEKIAEGIYFDFCKMRNIEIEGEENKCCILHISDLQFGGTISDSATNDNLRIAQFLLDNALNPDMIVITGDIADKGKTTEFRDAKKWLEELAKKTWNVEGELEENQKRRIITVPGNHDYDLSISAADAYRFVFKAEEKDHFDKIETPDYSAHQKEGFNHYNDFVKSLSDESNSLCVTEKLILLSNRFINNGVRLYLMNSVYGINARNCENRFDEFYCNLSDISDSNIRCEESAVDRVVNLLIMHNPPSSYDIGTADGCKSKGRFESIIEDNKINLCLYGHTHDIRPPFIFRDGGGKYCSELLCISAPSMRLSAGSRTEDASRGFNIIKIDASKEEKTDIEIAQYEIVKSIVKPQKTSKYQISSGKIKELYEE